MNIFLLGLPKSGRTTVAQALCKEGKFEYINASSWIRATFRPPKENELSLQYEEAYHQYLLNRLKIDPNLGNKNIQATMASYSHSFEFIIDGLINPKDFIQLFNYNEDLVVFLNRINNTEDSRDYQNIVISVIRDYCFWLSSIGLLEKKKWIEYNFKIPGEEDDSIKLLGSKNSVYVVKSLNKVISHLSNNILNLQAPRS